MILMDFDGSHVLGAPKGWDQTLDGRVEGLPVLPDIDPQSGLPVLYSVWRPDADELAMLMAGGAVRLGVLGGGHPIVNMLILKPETVRSAGCRDHLNMNEGPDQTAPD